MVDEEDIMTFKILLLGNQEVGKTSFIIRFTEDKFNESLLSTIGVDIKNKEIKRKDKNILLKIFDTAGEERFKSISKNYFASADGVLLLYDISNENSFKSIKEWVENIKENVNLSEIGLIIVGNKCDIPEEEKVVNNLMIKDLEKSLNVKIIEASAKSNINVTESFMLIVDKILELKFSGKNGERPDSVMLHNAKKNNKHICFLNKFLSNDN
jgi:small GTP-binding protein